MVKKKSIIVFLTVGIIILFIDLIFFSIVKINHIGQKKISGNTFIVRANVLSNVKFQSNTTGFYSTIINRDALLLAEEHNINIFNDLTSINGTELSSKINQNYDIFLYTQSFAKNKPLKINNLDYPNDESVLFSLNNNGDVIFFIKSFDIYFYILLAVGIFMLLLSGLLLFLSNKHTDFQSKHTNIVSEDSSKNNNDFNVYNGKMNNSTIKNQSNKITKNVSKADKSNEFAIENITGSIEKLTKEKIAKIEKEKKSSKNIMEKLKKQSKTLRRRDLH